MDWQYTNSAPNSAQNLSYHPYFPVPNRGTYSPSPYISYPSNYYDYSYYPQYHNYLQPSNYNYFQSPQHPIDRRYPTTYTQSSLTPPNRTQHRPRSRSSTSSHRSLYREASSLERSWLDIPDAPPENGPVFTLLCYNMLAQCLLDEHRNLYEHCAPLYSSWEYRKYYLLQQLIDSTADILCLQEVDETAYLSFFLPNLRERHFKGTYKRRTGEYTDGVAVFFNTNKFEVVVSKPVEYKRNLTILDRDNVGLILKLRVLGDSSSPGSPPTNNFLYVACTHLLFNPKAGDVKLGQVCVLLAELRELTSQDTETHPLIICGDMNCLPNSCLYCFLRTGYLNYKFLYRSEVSGYKKPPNGLIPYPLLSEDAGISNACKKVDTSAGPAGGSASDSYTLSHPYSFCSVYPHSLTEPSLVTTYHGSAFENVDYIFYSCPVLEIGKREEEFKTSRKLKLLSRYSLPSRSDLRNFGPLPNKLHSSDHLQLVAKFCYVT